VSNKAILVAAAAVLAVAATIAFLARDEPSAQLQALRADPMAEYTPAGGALVDTDEQNEGTTFGKPIAARYTRMFELPAGDAERELADAVAAAVAAGWTIEGEPERSLGDLVALGDRELPTGRAELALTLFTGVRPVPGGISAPALRISLEHLRP
jgi:hypothetical protein